MVLDLQIILYTLIALFFKQRALNWVSEKLSQFNVDVNIVKISKTKEIEVIESRNNPTWLPPQPFLNIGVKSRLIFEKFRSQSDI